MGWRRKFTLYKLQEEGLDTVEANASSATQGTYAIWGARKYLSILVSASSFSFTKTRRKLLG